MGAKKDAKAQRSARKDAQEDEDDTSGPPSGKAKKPEKKKDFLDKGMDAFEQMELQRQREARQRIVERFLRLILVGFVLDALKGSGKDSTKEDKKKKGNSKSSAGVKSIKEKANTYGGPAVMFAFIVAMLAIRAAEEGYHPADHDEHEFNYYEVMGLTKGRKNT
eukprot:g13728.t1